MAFFLTQGGRSYALPAENNLVTAEGGNTGEVAKRTNAFVTVSLSSLLYPIPLDGDSARPEKRPVVTAPMLLLNSIHTSERKTPGTEGICTGWGGVDGWVEISVKALSGNSGSYSLVRKVRVKAA